jgi:hypothetical protein
LNAANSVVGSTDVQEWSLASFFGRVQYDFDSKYLFTAPYAAMAPPNWRTTGVPCLRFQRVGVFRPNPS